MKRCLVLLFALGCTTSEPTSAEAKNPVVVMKTNKGTIKIELFEKEAPITVKNFLKYVDDKHYDGTVFHRVIPTFMIQGGGFTKDITSAKGNQDIRKAEKKTGKGIKNESTNGLSNKRGTIAMARTGEPDSATAQFFINVKDNDGLDRAKARDKVGYCVFGKVIEGMDVVDKIKDVKTKAIIEDVFEDVPKESVIIESVRLADK
jgi:cyclophilin family peptidyl-prolyl cis-trans isomerase